MNCFTEEVSAASGLTRSPNLAGVTKRPLYYHFKSKDELLAAVLDLQHELSLAHIRKYEDRYCGDPDEIVSVLFSELAKWSEKPGWAGTGFTRVAMELAGLPGHPARGAARRHKAAREAWYAEILAKARVASAPERAREIALLAEGATALILIHGDRSYADAAARAAKELLGKHRAKRAALDVSNGRNPRVE
jgi:AcrR family transcriptional regulator